MFVSLFPDWSVEVAFSITSHGTFFQWHYHTQLELDKFARMTDKLLNIRIVLFFACSFYLQCWMSDWNVEQSCPTTGCTCSPAINFLVAMVNSINTKALSSKEIAEFCFENANIKSICYCRG